MTTLDRVKNVEEKMELTPELSASVEKHVPALLEDLEREGVAFDENGGIGTTDTIFNGFSPLLKGNAKAGRQGRHFAELVIFDGMADTFGDLSCRHDIRVWKDKDEFSVLPSSEQIG